MAGNTASEKLTIEVEPGVLSILNQIANTGPEAKRLIATALNIPEDQARDVLVFIDEKRREYSARNS